MTEQRQNAEVIDIGGEVEIVERAPMTVVGIENLLRLAETADKRVVALNKLRLASIRATNDHDWIDQDGTPYLQASGAQKIAPLWGIGWQIISHSKTTGDDSYIWTTVLRLTDPAGRIVETIGTRSSRDLLFAKRAGKYLPMSEVDEPNIKKASATNAIARGVSAMVGLRNITWTELEEHGIKKEKTRVITRSSQTTATPDEKKHQTEVWEILTKINGGDTKKAIDQLELLTTFKGKEGNTISGLRVISKLKGKRLAVTLGKARDAFTAYTDALKEESDE